MTALDLPQLRAFHAVAKAGGFSAAASRLNLTQSAVSHAVGKLERSAKVRLLDAFLVFETYTTGGNARWARPDVAGGGSGFDHTETVNATIQVQPTDKIVGTVELNLLGVSDTFIVQESGPNQNAVSLGLFKTENRARILLGQLRAKGVENAGIEPRMGTSYRIQANVPANELRIVESAAPGLRARRQACTR